MSTATTDPALTESPAMTAPRPAYAAAPAGLGPVANRLLAALIFVLGGGLLGLASILTPADAGMGTHRQLGLPPCGFEQMTGLPCATCGCTTAFAHATNGSLLQSFVTQPFGGAAALGTAMLTLVAGWSLATGMPLAPVGRLMTSRVFVLSGIGILLAGWAYKIVLTLTAG